MKGTKLIAIALITVMAGAVVAMPVSAAITVDNDGTSDYNSIQEAVDNAAADSTVEVNPGVYYETVFVSTTGITINSTGSGTVHIVATKSNGTDAFNSSSGLATTPSLGPKVKAHDQNNLEVNTSGGNYDTINNAVDNSSHGDKIWIKPGTYNESVNVTSNYLYFRSTDLNSNVTVDSSNVTGSPFNTSSSNGTYFHSSIKSASGILMGGGGSGSDGGVSFSLSGTTAGIPNMLIVLAVVAGLAIAYSRRDEMN